MRSYAKKTENTKEKRKLFFCFFTHILGIFFFMTYSSIMLTEHAGLCIILYLFSVMASIGAAGSTLEYTEEEKTTGKYLSERK